MGESSWLQILGSFGAGLSGGTLSGLFGIGGGLVLVPLLALLLGISQHQAQGLSLAALLFPNSLPAILHFKKRGLPLHVALATAIILAFLPGMWAGARIANQLPPGLLRWIFATCLVLLAAKTIFQKKPTELSERQPIRWQPGLLIGLVGGLCGGLLGIGGGVVMIPLMVLWMKLPQHEAQLTSLLVMLPPVGLPGVWVYFHHQNQGGFPWALVLGLALGFQFGAFAGARIATRIKGRNLQSAFAGIMVVFAVLLLIR